MNNLNSNSRLEEIISGDMTNELGYIILSPKGNNFNAMKSLGNGLLLVVSGKIKDRAVEFSYDNFKVDVITLEFDLAFLPNDTVRSRTYKNYLKKAELFANACHRRLGDVVKQSIKGVEFPDKYIIPLFA